MAGSSESNQAYIGFCSLLFIYNVSSTWLHKRKKMYLRYTSLVKVKLRCYMHFITYEHKTVSSHIQYIDSVCMYLPLLLRWKNIRKNKFQKLTWVHFLQLNCRFATGIGYLQSQLISTGKLLPMKYVKYIKLVDSLILYIVPYIFARAVF